MEIEVNGVKYRQKESTTKSIGSAATISALASIYASVAMYPGYKRSYKKEMPPYNLLDEIKLIQNKQSKLSRSEREYIQREFNRIFEPIN